MSSLRTQVYLTREQRRSLDRRGAREGKTLAHLIREAVDRYLEDDVPDVETALTATFGTMPDLDVPARTEWDRGNG